MTTIVKRLTKGSALTWTEVDNNFNNLNTAKYESGDSPSFAAVTITTGALTGKLGGAYSNILGLGVTPTDWSNTLLPVTGMQFGDRGAYYQYSGEVILGFNVKVNSSYQDVAITASGTPAKLKVGAGAVTMQTATTNPGAGSAITFTNIARADGSYITGGSFVVDVGRVSFPATQNSTTDANTLDDYEEGTWTPVDASGAGLSFTSVSGSYIKVGKMVYIACELTYPVTANGSNASIGGLPFTSMATGARASLAKGYPAGSTNPTSALIPINGTVITPYAGAGVALNSQCSTQNLFFSGCYQASA